MTGDGDPVNPYPGLRPFTPEQAHLFFGREEQTDQLVRRLRLNRLLAVIGTSGCGKSSLVQAGLLPRLHGGQMAKAGAAWRIATMRPGADPIGNLTRALNAPGVFGSSVPGSALSPGLFTEPTLRRGPLGLVEVARHNRLAPDENLLILVDQFEEMFRFARIAPVGATDDRAAFVKLLLGAVQPGTSAGGASAAAGGIYVVLTMRSDFVGDCARYRGLTEAVNEGQYLVPRMTRDQLRKAIVGPAIVGGTDITPRLVQRLLADAGDDPDQLPLLQHALMRTWTLWADGGRDGAIDLATYEATGGLATALSNHADEAYAELPDDRSRAICQRLFQCLTERSEDHREARVPARIETICGVSEAREEEVVAIVDVFRRADRSFLTCADASLSAASTVEISHESLMRVWTRLKDWVAEEFDAATRYRRLAQTAALNEAGESPLLTDTELTRTLEWQAVRRPNAAWAARYDRAFDRTLGFLHRSREARDAAMFSYSEIALYLGAFVLMCGGLFYFIAEVGDPGERWGSTWAFVWLALPFMGLNLAGLYQAQRSRNAVSVTFYIGGLVLLPLFLIILLHENAWLADFAYQWPSLLVLAAPLAALGIIASLRTTTRTWLPSNAVIVGMAVLLPMIVQLVYHARNPGEPPSSLLPEYNNAELQAALLVACGWAMWLSLRTHGSALSAAFALACVLVACVTLPNVGLIAWVGEEAWHVLALNLLPLVTAFAGLAFVLQRSGRTWYGPALYAGAAVLAVLVLELLAQNGKQLEYLGISLARFAAGDDDSRQRLETMVGMSLNGALFCAAAWLLGRNGQEAVRAASKLLFILAPFAMLEPMAYISGTKEYSEVFDWTFLGLALVTAILTHHLRRRSFYYAGLVNCGVAFWLIADRNEWLNDHRWAVALILFGLTGLVVGYELEQRRQRRLASAGSERRAGAHGEAPLVKATV